MLILLDENLLSKKLKHPLAKAGHSVKNVEDMSWRGTRERQLLVLAEAQSFDAFITADKNLPYRQNLRGLTVRVIVLNFISTRPASLLPLIVEIIPLIVEISGLLQSLTAGSVTLIDDNRIDDNREVTSFEADA